MVRQKSYETTSTDNLVDYQPDSFDTSLKSDTAQQIIQRWIEVWFGDIFKCQFTSSVEVHCVSAQKCSSLRIDRL